MAMSGLLEIFTENPAAAGFGLAGLACQMAWPLFRSRHWILTTQFGAGVDYSLQYALLGAWSGASVAGLGATQTAILVLAGDKPWLRYLGPVMLPLVTAICIATWSGPESFCALVAVTLVMIGRLQRDTIRLRILLLAAAPFGMGYDILTGAAPALAGAVASAAIATTMLMREMKARNRLRAATGQLGAAKIG